MLPIIMSWQTCGRPRLISLVTFHLLISLMCLRQTTSTKVHLDYTDHYSADQHIPDKLTISISNGSLDLGRAHLKRSPFDFNVPVYILWTGPDGKLQCTQEKIRDLKNVGFYQDLATEAVFQVTSTSDLEGSRPRLVLKGELSLDGQKYILSPGGERKKRDASSPPTTSTTTTSSPSASANPDDDTYELKPDETKSFFNKDSLLPGPEVKISLSHLTPEKPVLISLLDNKNPQSSPDQVDSSLFKERSASISLSRKSRSTRGSERMRRQATVYYVDVVAVIDYGAYQRFLGDAGSRSGALEAIREYYSFVFNGMDLRYQNIPNVNYRIRVRLTKVIISETKSAASFTEEFRVARPGSPWDTVNALSALNSFSDFVVGTGADFINPYDHSMLFTGYDLSSTTETGNTLTTTGLAYTGTLCRTDGLAVSIVEDLGGFQSIDTAAHELGHSLSAKHDGEENLCRSTDRYIMSGGTYPQTEANALNPWEFSVCSANYFTTFISDEIRTSRGRTCLNLPLSISASIPDVSDRLPGQEFTPDQQCAQIYGSRSRLCRGREFGNDICTAMFCFDPATEGTCYEQTAVRGTTCGNRKICLGGDCVEDPRAPSVDENCLFGDQPGAAFSGQTCEAFVSGFTGYCYQELVRGRCCSSCKKIYRQVRDCEYGDKVDGCRANVCQFADVNYRSQCCGTCNYGEPFTTTGTTKPDTTVEITTVSFLSTTTAQRTQAPTSSTGCSDNQEVLVNGRSCRDAVEATPNLCYQSSVLGVCCASCERVSTGVQGCEYGDRFPTGCSTLNTCVGFEQSCCDTCRGGGDSTTVATTTTPVTTKSPTSTCLDNPMIRINGETCRVSVRSDPEVCNVQEVSISCCLSCEELTRDPETTTSTNPPPTTPDITSVTEAPVCQDNPLIQVNSRSCQSAVQSNPGLCYFPNVARDCCFSCSQAHTGAIGCEYGDRSPDLCSNLSDCTGFVLQCCATCSDGNNNNNNNNNNQGPGGSAPDPSTSRPFITLLSVFTASLFGRWFRISGL